MSKAPQSAGTATKMPWRWRLPLGLACLALLLGGGLATAQTQSQGETQGSGQAAGAPEQLVLARPWARVYAQPAAMSRHIAIVYGNDALPVLERKDGWVKIRVGSQVGWLSPEDAGGSPEGAGPSAPGPGSRAESAALLPTLPAVAESPASPDTLRRLGYEEAARRKLTQMLLYPRNDVDAYRATREMLTYHPVGELAPLQDNVVPQQARATARRLREAVLIEEAHSLMREGKAWDAVFLYQAMTESEPKDGKAHQELLSLMTDIMVRSARSPNMENLGLALAIYRKTFPDVAVPAEVEARMKGNGRK